VDPVHIDAGIAAMRELLRRPLFRQRKLTPRLAEDLGGRDRRHAGRGAVASPARLVRSRLASSCRYASGRGLSVVGDLTEAAEAPRRPEGQQAPVPATAAYSTASAASPAAPAMAAGLVWMGVGT
jgi:hypothetical protein